MNVTQRNESHWLKRPKVYCIPGFGVDEGIFANLEVDADLQFLNWIKPYQQESIEGYARRMAVKIEEQQPVILGVSFGGMIAVEINKFLPAKQLIIISGVKCRRELPFHLRCIGHLRLDKIFPVRKIQQSEKVYEIANKRLGAFTPEEKAFANAYRRNADIGYVNWSFDKILNWKNKDYPSHTIHIHGDCDKIFPLKTISPTHVIKSGTHMMIYNRANEISTIINKVLGEMPVLS
ncbi:alpha/beta fold hydrolase [Niabella aquatica]